MDLLKTWTFNYVVISLGIFYVPRTFAKFYFYSFVLNKIPNTARTERVKIGVFPLSTRQLFDIGLILGHRLRC